MRINRNILLKIARDTVNSRIRTNRNILAAYLDGSVVGGEEPVLGGTADIDLVLVHDGYPPVEREIVRLTEDVHLDIAHHDRVQYRRPKSLRDHPWLGSAIYRCQILHDPRHFLDFTQASVRSHFFRPDNVLKRAQAQVKPARQTWFSFQFFDADPELTDVMKYLQAVADSANAIACLNGRPLPERRFLEQFQDRVEALDKPGFHAGLLGLLGAPFVSEEDLHRWLPTWERAYNAVGKLDDPPWDLHPYRFSYYRKGFDELLGSGQPMNVLWPMLITWTKSACNLVNEPDIQGEWKDAFLELGLLGSGFKERIAALDVFLDLVEETIEKWGKAQGV